MFPNEIYPRWQWTSTCDLASTFASWYIYESSLYPSHHSSTSWPMTKTFSSLVLNWCPAESFRWQNGSTHTLLSGFLDACCKQQNIFFFWTKINVIEPNMDNVSITLLLWNGLFKKTKSKRKWEKHQETTTCGSISTQHPAPWYGQSRRIPGVAHAAWWYPHDQCCYHRWSSPDCPAPISHSPQSGSRSHQCKQPRINNNINKP